jgi:ATP-dependent RNA helicase DeaD
MQLKDFLKETLDLGRDDVYKVDVKEGFSFFNTDAEHLDKVMEILNNTQIEGRRINVEISKNDGGGRRDHNNRGGSGGGRSGGERSFGGRSSGGFGPKREGSGGFGAKREGGFRSERSNDRPSEGGFGRRSAAPKREGFSDRTSGNDSSDRAPRRSESFGDSPRPRRTRKS